LGTFGDDPELWCRTGVSAAREPVAEPPKIRPARTRHMATRPARDAIGGRESAFDIDDA
jgi:hypothetical protein